MERDTPSPSAGLTEADDRLLRELAAGIARRGLAAPAVVTLACLRPAAFLGGQALRCLAPFLQLVAEGRDWDRIAQILEVRGSVERLLSHLEARPDAVPERREAARPDGSAYVVVDCGSTTTKAVLFARREGRYRLIGRAESPTTVEAPVADVMVGVRSALGLLEKQTGHSLRQADGRLEPAQGPDRGVGALLATSSAGGGLQMLVLGLVDSMTAASAERAALGAGAIVTDILSWNDDQEETARLERLRRCRPDMVLMAGGTDGGARAQVVALAEMLAAAELQPRWGDGRLPVVYAGNREAAAPVVAALGDRAEVVVAPNLRPDLQTERLAPARRVLHEVFLRHVMARAPGYPDLQRLCSAPVLPTPASFGEALDLLADRQGGDAVAVDLGGATTDVFSVRDGQVFRSVSANLGLSFSLGAVCHAAGWAQIARWLPLALTEDDLRDRVRNKMIRPTTLPQTPEDLLLEQGAAREALRLALTDHERALQPLRGAREGPTGVDALAVEPEAAAGVAWPRVRLLVGSGGPLAHAPRRSQAAAILIDGCRPEGLTELAVDSVFVLPHLGALRQVDPEAAAAVLDADALVPLGACLAPIGAARVPDGAPIADLVLTDPEGAAAPVSRTMLGGRLECLPLPAGALRHLAVRPRAGWDFGNGPGRPWDALVGGGVVGLVLDSRGRELPWPAAELARRELVRGWLAALDALPPGVVL
jgi:uncharacterized protein (TIGR01319 family)